MNNTSFGIKDPIDYSKKIQREFDRLDSSKNIQDKVDHSLNFAFTAWHLVDWLWKHNPTKAKLKNLGFNKFEDFLSYTRNTCTGLQICYEVALGFKHFELRESQSKSVKSANKVTTSKDGIVKPLVRPLVQPFVQPLVRGSTTELIVTKHDGTKTKFSVVAEDVKDYWKSRLLVFGINNLTTFATYL